MIMRTNNEETELEILTEFFINDYIEDLEWSKDCCDYIKTIVVGNIRAYHQYLYDNYFLNEENVLGYAKSESKK